MNGYARTVPTTSSSARALAGGSRLDSGFTALILGAFAFMWFGWGQAGASKALGALLLVGSGVAFAIAAAGGVETFRNRHTPSAFSDEPTRRRYGAVVGIESAAAFVGAAILGGVGAGAYIPVWICAVTGLHFFPLSRVLKSPPVRALGVAVTAVAAGALLVGLVTNVAPGNVTGAGAGVALIAFSALSLLGGWRGRVATEDLRLTQPG